MLPVSHLVHHSGIICTSYLSFSFGVIEVFGVWGWGFCYAVLGIFYIWTSDKQCSQCPPMHHSESIFTNLPPPPFNCPTKSSDLLARQIYVHTDLCGTIWEENRKVKKSSQQCFVNWNLEVSIGIGQIWADSVKGHKLRWSHTLCV